MKETMAVFAGKNLETLVAGLARIRKQGTLDLGLRPQEYEAGDVLLMAQKGNSEFSFVGFLKGARLSAEGTRLEEFDVVDLKERVVFIRNKELIRPDLVGEQKGGPGSAIYYVANDAVRQCVAEVGVREPS